MEADYASAHTRLVLDNRLSSSATVLPYNGGPTRMEAGNASMPLPTIQQCSLVTYPAVPLCRRSAVHNGGPTRMKAENASAHHSVVLDSCLSSSVVVQQCRRANGGPTRMEEENASAHHSIVMLANLSAVPQCRSASLHNDGPNRTEADNASVHHPVVLDSRSSINSAVSGLERLRARSTGGGYCLCLPFSSAHPAFQLYRALNNCGPALMKEDVAYAHHPAAR